MNNPMKTHKLPGLCLAFLSLLAAAWAAPAQSPSDAAPLKKALEDAQHGDFDFSALGKVFAVRRLSPNASIQNHIVLGCAAGSLAAGKTDFYNQRLRPLVPLVVPFEKSLLRDCPSCSGSGKKTGQCKNCRGSGRCPSPSCQDGTQVMHGLNGRVTTMPCPSCGGSGSCRACKGTGEVQTPCHACFGRGGTFDTSVALEICKDHVSQALEELEGVEAARNAARRKAEIQARRDAIDAEAYKQEKEARVRAIAVEAEARGKARAEQDAKAAAAEAERKRKADEEKKYAEQDRRFIPSIVIIEGDLSVGTGFICIFGGKKVVVSNAHVLNGNSEVRLRLVSSGEEIQHTKIWVCPKRDVALYELANPEIAPALSVYDISSNKLSNDEKIVVFGNSDGGGVATTLRGKVQGIGPDEVEVQADFVSGNSGSPIIAYDYGKVIGMATYARKLDVKSWATENTRFAGGNVRRFGVRLDNLSWNDFEKVDFHQYLQGLDIVKDAIDFVDQQLLPVLRQGRRYSPSPAARQRAASLCSQLDDPSVVPPWMMRFSDDNSLYRTLCHKIAGAD
jgi:hypothetical protein